MEKDAPQEQWGELELNQQGRPKQKVIFYQLTQEMKEEAEQQLAQDPTVVTEQQYQAMTGCGQKVWDKFYQFHKCNFFKDRTYLERQMPQVTYFKKQHQLTGKISCGVGNTLFPLLRQFVCFNYYGCDISKKAVNLIEEEMIKHPDLQPRMKVCVCDLVLHDIPYQQTGDLNSLIFVLSAIAPQKHSFVVKKVADSMKPSSFLFFRDYGRYDFGQLNLSSKRNRKLKDNFYRKNDGVCVYYFDEKQLADLFTEAGLTIIKINLHCKLLVNRKTGLKMYRVWIQGRFYKAPLEPFFEQQLKQQIQKEIKQQLEEEKIGEKELEEYKQQKLKQNYQKQNKEEKGEKQIQKQETEKQEQNIKQQQQDQTPISAASKQEQI